MSAIVYVAGPVIWENPDYVSPNDLRAAEKKQVRHLKMQRKWDILNVLYIPIRIGCAGTLHDSPSSSDCQKA